MKRTRKSERLPFGEWKALVRSMTQLGSDKDLRFLHANGYSPMQAVDNLRGHAD